MSTNSDRLARLGFAALVASLALGCGDGSAKQSAPLIARGDPGFVRIVNLSDKAVTGEIGTAYKNLSVEPGQMTTARPVRSGKPSLVKIFRDGKPTELEVVPDPKAFVSVIVGNGGLDSFNSGEGTSAAENAKLDLANFTDKAIEFVVQGGEKHVIEPNSSKTVPIPFGQISVGAVGMSEVKLEAGPAMVWSVFAYSASGKPKLGSKNLKGDGQAVGTGGPS